MKVLEEEHEKETHLLAQEFPLLSLTIEWTEKTRLQFRVLPFNHGNKRLMYDRQNLLKLGWTREMLKGRALNIHPVKAELD